MKKLLVFTALTAAMACGSSDQQAKEEKPQGPLSKSANPESFNTAFGKLLSDYYHLKDGFVSENDTAITLYAKNLVKDADSLNPKQLKADTVIVATAVTYAQGISAELKGLLGEKNIDAKRKSFEMVGKQLYDLIRTVQYDREIVYHEYCPMAFNDEGADWLSNSSDIRNPYIPKKMLTCGEVKDSINYIKK